MTSLELCPLVLKNEKPQNHTNEKFTGYLPASRQSPSPVSILHLTVERSHSSRHKFQRVSLSENQVKWPQPKQEVRTKGVRPEETEGRLSQVPLFSSLLHTKALRGPPEGHPGSGFCHCFLILARLGAGQKGNPPNKEREESQTDPTHTPGRRCSWPSSSRTVQRDENHESKPSPGNILKMTSLSN